MSDNKKKKKSRLIIYAEFIPFWCLYQLIRNMNLRLAYFLSRHLFRIMFLLDRRHRTRAISHLLHAGVAHDEIEAKRMAWESYRNFSMLMVEIFKLDQLIRPGRIRAIGSESTIRDVCRFGGHNRNVIIVTAHYGNWELAGTSWAREFGLSMVSVYRRFANPLIGDYIMRHRQSEVHQSVPKDGGIKGLLKALRQGKTVAILADQHANAREGVETVFFGQPCRTHASPALLHLKTGVPIAPELTRRIGNNFDFEFVVGDLIEYEPTGDKEKDVQTITQLYTSALEKMIREEPTQWLWAHRRWLNINRGKHHHQAATQKKSAAA